MTDLLFNLMLLCYPVIAIGVISANLFLLVIAKRLGALLRELS